MLFCSGGLVKFLQAHESFFKGIRILLAFTDSDFFVLNCR